MECGLQRALLISILFLVGGGTTIALDAPSAPRERTILVSIFDKNGHPVRQLSTDSIQVAENGQPVKILRLRPADDSAILFTVLVDTSKWAHQEKTSAALDGVVDFLSRVVRKDDRIAIASFSDRFHYGNPTSDLVQAKREINNLNWGVR